MHTAPCLYQKLSIPTFEIIKLLWFSIYQSLIGICGTRGFQVVSLPNTKKFQDCFMSTIKQTASPTEKAYSCHFFLLGC